MFDANRFHIEATLDITDSDKLTKHFFLFFTKKDIYSPKVVVTLLQVFPNLFPCVYLLCCLQRSRIFKVCILMCLFLMIQMYFLFILHVLHVLIYMLSRLIAIHS